MRCRKCKSRFAAVSYAPLGGEPRTEELPALAPPEDASPASDLARHSAEPLVDAFEDYDSSEIELGPGDSQYELTSGAEGFADDDSQVDLPALAPGPREPKRFQAAGVANGSTAGSVPWEIGIGESPKPNRPGRHHNATILASGSESDPPERAAFREVPGAKPVLFFTSNGRFVHIWSRYQLVTTLAFGATALCILGFFVLRSSIGGQPLTPATSTLVVGLLGTVAFVLLSLTAIVLSALLSELARDLRRLYK